MSFSERHQSLFIGSLLLALLVSLSTYLITNKKLQRLDHVLYDVLLPIQTQAISDQITIISIDNNSLMELGRWPWSRIRHAELINKLSTMQARAIGLDIIFSEHQRDESQADLMLAEAIKNNGKTILAVAPTKQNNNDLITELLPIPKLATAAESLGHVDVELDIDGLCRSTFLYAGIGDARWPSFALALFMAGGNTLPIFNDTPTSQTEGWLRRHKILIPFTNPTNRPKIISYSDVLADRISTSDIKDKYILVGATATGLGDAISTPGSLSHERMPGVELNAQILNGLLQDTIIQEATNEEKIILSLLLTTLIVLIILLTPLRFGIIVTLFALASVLIITIMLLVYQQIWFPPSAILFSILLAWPLWSVWFFGLEKRLRIRLLQQLEHQARYHLASGLPNHGMLQDKLRSLPDFSDTKNELSCLMVLHINWPGSASIIVDRPISDPILKSISLRLRNITTENDYIAHLSGDDFAIFSTGYKNNDEITQTAANVLRKLQEPLSHDGDVLLLAPQIGVSIWPTDTQDPQALLRNAYTAMFKSRIDETEHLCIYSSNVSNELSARSELEKALVFALKRNEFVVYYQPQVCAQTGSIVGVEALLRWHNPILGWVGPDSFIPIAEHVGLINAIGDWVIKTSINQLKIWKEAGLGPLRLAINISPLQFVVPGLDNGIKKIINNVGINPDDVELEITESSLMHDINSAIQMMKNIKNFGLELAIDDFGTGYSSLGNLRHFPLDRLKIDQSFTREIGEKSDSSEITLTILAMAKQLGLKVIAEGVENEEQANFLRFHGCEEFQGFLYGRPASADEITKLLLKKTNLKIT